jgi:predicted lipid-binding transport protein (Tim44 family)
MSDASIEHQAGGRHIEGIRFGQFRRRQGMNRLLAIAAMLVAMTAWMAADVAEAKRLGGGRSIGSQRQITPAPAPNTPNAAPSAPSGPAQAAPARPAAAPAASGASRWLGPLAGLAAGIGLAALLSHFGLSEGFASLLLLGLVIVAGVLLVRWLFMKRAPAVSYAGATAARVEPTVSRPSATFEPVMSGAQPLPAPAADRYPPGFDPAPFIEQAKVQFRKLQSAYDEADRKALAEVMTPDMFAEVSRDLAQRETHLPTEVVRLDAEVLDVTTEGSKHLMSVRFNGLLREDGTVLPKEFDEVWNLVKPVDGSSGWLLAGIQQTHEVA